MQVILRAANSSVAGIKVAQAGVLLTVMKTLIEYIIINDFPFYTHCDLLC
jgi:hypothetical protein